MAFSKKLTCKGTLRQVVYLSEAPSLPMTLHPPPLHTVYVYTSYLYTYDLYGPCVMFLIRADNITRAKKRLQTAIVLKAGRKYQHD
jgi:hypothetical protein